MGGVLLVGIGLTSSNTHAGEQTGGRRGMTSDAQSVSLVQISHTSEILPGEQSGGRKP